MGIFNTNKKYTQQEFDDKLNSKKAKGKIIDFNNIFYSMMEGLYFNGLPIYYYLEKMSMNRCYDTSLILGFALGDCEICRGILDRITDIDGKDFGHGWVEKDGLIYDTTWKIITDRKTYYELFGVKKVKRHNSKDYFNQIKEVSNWKIHDKEYYENNSDESANLLIFQTRELEKSILENKNSSEEDKEFAKRVLGDLPQVTLRAEIDVSIYQK